MPQDGGSSKSIRSDILLRESEISRGTSQSRDRVRHELIELAEGSSDNALWERIGKHLLDMLDKDDLRALVSDHFVSRCPDKAFEKIALIYPEKKLFQFWFHRARPYRMQYAIGKRDGWQKRKRMNRDSRQRRHN